jgi:hypothetical protein
LSDFIILYDLIIWLRTAFCPKFGDESFSELAMTPELTRLKFEWSLKLYLL